MNTKEEITNWLKTLQDEICEALQTADGSAKFKEDIWERTEGGGGRSRVMENGCVIEKGGVMFSAVHGNVPDFLLNEKQHSITHTQTLSEQDTELRRLSGVEASRSIETPTFYATGVSIVIHPQNPFVPIIHMNIRYFEMSNGTRWLGGGIDLTPHYINDEDARFFHEQLKMVCDKHHASLYPKFKTWADDYFYISHRKETRGIGGIFFDRLNSDDVLSFDKYMEFWKELGKTFAPIYTELMARNKNKIFTEENKQWQLLRRGRYVEFNLVYDKGTKFGLETNGRVESILMSLPANASWLYNYQVQENSAEADTLSKLKKAINWA